MKCLLAVCIRANAIAELNGRKSLILSRDSWSLLLDSVRFLSIAFSLVHFTFLIFVSHTFALFSLPLRFCPALFLFPWPNVNFVVVSLKWDVICSSFSNFLMDLVRWKCKQKPCYRQRTIIPHNITSIQSYEREKYCFPYDTYICVHKTEYLTGVWRWGGKNGVPSGNVTRLSVSNDYYIVNGTFWYWMTNTTTTKQVMNAPKWKIMNDNDLFPQKKTVWKMEWSVYQFSSDISAKSEQK